MTAPGSPPGPGGGDATLLADLLADLPRATLARASGTTVGDVTSWRDGAPLPVEARNRLRALHAAVAVFRGRRPRGNLPRWLDAPSVLLDGTMVDAIRAEPDPAHLGVIVNLRVLEPDW